MEHVIKVACRIYIKIFMYCCRFPFDTNASKVYTSTTSRFACFFFVL